MKNSQVSQRFFASCPKFIEGLLSDEILLHGGQNIRTIPAGVYFDADDRSLYRMLLWSRLANRFFQSVAQGPVGATESLYSLVESIDWTSIVGEPESLVVDFSGTNEAIRNTHYGAQVVKDAIVDCFRKQTLQIPVVDKDRPRIRVRAVLKRGRGTISLDLCGESLHRRGYRAGQTLAPLKENLASAILLRARFPDILESAVSKNTSFCLIDPMCGSGTLLFEACGMAAKLAPGLNRDRFAICDLPEFQSELWRDVVLDAEKAQDWEVLSRLRVVGADKDPSAIESAQAASAALDWPLKPEFYCQSLEQVSKLKPDDTTSGLIVTNPPYGVRVGEREALEALYFELAQVLKANFNGWDAAIFSGDTELVRGMRMRREKKYSLLNGSIPSELHVFKLNESALREDKPWKELALSDDAEMLANRLKKNSAKLEKWRRRESVSCYRLYDADIPEYASAIDIYGSQIHVQEYQAPKAIDTAKAKRRIRETLHAVAHVFSCDNDAIVLKQRTRQKGKAQYQKTDSCSDEFFAVDEFDAKLEVNLKDYLDTGLFLDHRPLRRMIKQSARGKSFLNLFCYTASATVHAAMGGATSSVSVDMSNTYLDWARRNFSLNNIREQRHQLVRSDAVKWLAGCRQGFDLIMLDPPSFSNSKSTDTVLDIQRDHVSLIARCLEILNPDGILYFSTNLRSFNLDEEIKRIAEVENISQLTLDPDFARKPKLHQCFKLSVK